MHPTQCGPWADAGECERNPGFMRARCRDSCGACEWRLLDDAPFEFIALGEPANATAERHHRRRAAAAEDPDAAAEIWRAAAEEDRAAAAEAAKAGKGAAAAEPAGLVVGMPAIGFGTAGLGEATARAVEDAILAGYALIDTAEVRLGARGGVFKGGVRTAQ